MKRTGILLLICMLLSGCAQNGKGEPLTQEEIAQANLAFQYADSVTLEDHTVVYPSEVSCFFTSFYEDPTQISLEEFLRYCPIDTDLGDSDVEEYHAVLRAVESDPEKFPLPSDYVVPVHRYRKAEVSALLKKYAGITVDELDSLEGTVYLAEYDCFYNFTSDFGPGVFECVEGERKGDTIRLRSAPHWDDGCVRELTVQEVDGAYLIRSFVRLGEAALENTEQPESVLEATTGE